MGLPRPLFHLFLFFSDKQYNSYNKSMWHNVMSIQYRAPGYEPTTFRMWVSSHNHKTRAPTRHLSSFVIYFIWNENETHKWEIVCSNSGNRFYMENFSFICWKICFSLRWGDRNKLNICYVHFINMVLIGTSTSAYLHALWWAV